MIKNRKADRWRTIASITVLLLLSAYSVFAEQDTQETEPNFVTGELNIQGKYIRQLVLIDDQGKQQKIDNPQKSITLPAGIYRLGQVLLESGFSHYDWKSKITIDPNDTAVLKVGAPLKQKIKAYHQGRILVMDYELLGIGKEKYTGGSGSKPPRFEIYKDQQQIASGAFEYG